MNELKLKAKSLRAGQLVEVVTNDYRGVVEGRLEKWEGLLNDWLTLTGPEGRFIVCKTGKGAHFGRGVVSVRVAD